MCVCVGGGGGGIKNGAVKDEYKEGGGVGGGPVSLTSFRFCCLGARSLSRPVCGPFGQH